MIQKYVRKCQNVYQYQARVMLTLCHFASIKVTNPALYHASNCAIKSSTLFALYIRPASTSSNAC